MENCGRGPSFDTVPVQLFLANGAALASSFRCARSDDLAPGIAVTIDRQYVAASSAVGLFPGTKGQVCPPCGRRRDHERGRGRSAILGVVVYSPVRLFAEGVAACLDAQPDTRAVACHDVQSLGAELEAGGAGVVLVDVTDRRAIEQGRALIQAFPDVKAIALALPEAAEDVIACADAGFVSYVPRNACVEDMCEVLRRALRDEVFCDPKVSGGLLRELRRRQAMSAPASEPGDELTRREREVLAPARPANEQQGDRAPALPQHRDGQESRPFDPDEAQRPRPLGGAGAAAGGSDDRRLLVRPAVSRERAAASLPIRNPDRRDSSTPLVLVLAAHLPAHRRDAVERGHLGPEILLALGKLRRDPGAVEAAERREQRQDDVRELVDQQSDVVIPVPGPRGR